MKILSLNLKDDNGLSDIKMKRLDKIVLIAGKNGSGKSRLLNAIKAKLTTKNTNSKLAQLERARIDAETNISRFTITVALLKQQLINSQDQKKINDLEQLEKAIIDNKKIVEINSEIIETHQDEIKTDKIYDNYEAIDFVPKQLNLDNPENKTKQNINIIIQDKRKGISNSQIKTLVLIQDIIDKWFRATHQDLKTEDSFKQKAIENYEKLKEYIKKFLDTDLDFNQEDGSAEIFGFKLAQSDQLLSDGQKILLQLCMTIYEQENDLEKTILFMDEPENHLHPKALLDVINKLSDIITEGQIWIATHSINLLSNFEPKNIWYMEDGKIQHAGKIPEKVLEGLLGDQKNILKLENFISLPSQMATNNFAFECLFEPLQVETGIDDPQVGQIIDAIKSKYNDSGKVKILDFGAGKGRLLSTIDEIGKIKNIQTIDWLEYYAYDLPSDNKQQCLNILNDIYENGENRYFDNKSLFKDNTEENSFDMIVLSNVFHEIDPIHWNDEFGKSSLISYALKENGILLIIEDQLIPVGEKAYQNGFLVFDKEQFKKLFNIPDYGVKAERNGRLKAHYIEKKFLKNMTHETKKEAIESLKTRAKDKITEIRLQDTSYENGKLHAFWTQQLANSYLAYSQL